MTQFVSIFYFLLRVALLTVINTYDHISSDRIKYISENIVLDNAPFVRLITVVLITRLWNTNNAARVTTSRNGKQA